MITGSLHRPKLGLALSGGTLKAAAHVGVLDALSAMGLSFDCIAGTSAGSYVGALYAHGVLPKEMVQMVQSFPGKRLLDYGFPLGSSLFTLLSYRLLPRHRKRPFRLPSGLLRGRRLEHYFRKSLQGRKLTNPYCVIATDLYSGLPVVYADPAVFRALGTPETLERMSMQRSIRPIGDVARTIRGSCSLPGIFTPVTIGEHLLVDGGLRSYVPAQVLRDFGCTHIIAVNLYRLQEQWYPETFAHVLTRSLDIILDETIDEDVKGDDIFSICPDIRQISWVSFSSMLNSVEAGRQAVFDKQRELEDFLLRTPPVKNEKRTKASVPSVPEIRIS